MFHAATSALAVGITMPVLAGTAIAFRFLARKKRDQRIGADDYAIVVGWVCLAGMCATSIYGVEAAGEGLPTPVLFTNPTLLLRNLKV